MKEMTVLFGLSLSVLGALTACGPEGQQMTTDPSLVVAEDRLGPITAYEVDRFLLDQSANRRWRAETDPVQWYSTVVRRIAIDRLLLDLAREAKAEEDPEFKTLERRILRNAYSEKYVREMTSLDAPPSDEELRVYFEEHQGRFSREERREVVHIYKRLPPGGDHGPLLEELTGLRERALAGESFELLAREYSDSESRHTDGRLGFVRPGDHSKDFDSVVFSLERGVPSAPVKTPDGAHVFLVTSILEARSFDFEEIRGVIIRELLLERHRQALIETAQGLPQADILFVPGPQRIANLVRSGDLNAIILKIGDFELSVRQFNELIATLRRQLGPRVDSELPLRVLEELRCREIIFQHLLTDGLPEIEPDRLEHEHRKQLIEYYADTLMRKRVSNSPEKLRQHYSNNLMRFASPLRVHVIQLRSPLGEDPGARMAILEEARTRLNTGETDLENLALKLGGEIRDLGFVNPAMLKAIDPRALRFAFMLKPGEYSPPYREGNVLMLFQVTGRIEPSPRPLAEVRDQVIHDYLVNYSPAVFREITDQLLDDAGFEIHQDRLERMGPVLSSG